MRVFVDTSALISMLDAADPNCRQAGETWRQFPTRGDCPVCTNYVVVETLVVLQRRLGMAAAEAFQQDVVPLLSVHWVDAELHGIGVANLFAARRRGLSLIDCISFAVMRRLGIDTAFTFDAHFAQQGFVCLPGNPASAKT